MVEFLVGLEAAVRLEARLQGLGQLDVHRLRLLRVDGRRHAQVLGLRVAGRGLPHPDASSYALT